MRKAFLLGALLLTACQAKTTSGTPDNAEKSRHMNVMRASIRELPDQHGARLVTWETQFHSCDPFKELYVKRNGNVVNIDVLTTPPPGACTGESGSMQKNSIVLPVGTFYTDRYRISEPITVRLNGKEIGVVNPE